MVWVALCAAEADTELDATKLASAVAEAKVAVAEADAEVAASGRTRNAAQTNKGGGSVSHAPRFGRRPGNPLFFVRLPDD